MVKRSGKKVGRRKDLLNIEVSGLGRIRQRDPGVGFSLLVYKILHGFGIDPDALPPEMKVGDNPPEDAIIDFHELGASRQSTEIVRRGRDRFQISKTKAR